MFHIISYLLISFTYCSAYLYNPIYFKEEEVRHVRAPVDTKPPCEEQKLIDLLAERQITNPENIIGIPINDFEGTCPATLLTLKKVDNLYKNCTVQENLYSSLLYGLRVLDEQLCKNHEFFKKYEKFSKCYSDLSKDFDSCNGTPDWNEDEPKRVCKIYKRIVDCYYIKTAKVCGVVAASYLKQLMREVLDCSLLVKCSAGASPKVKDAMSDKYVDKTNKGSTFSQNFILILSLIYLLK